MELLILIHLIVNVFSWVLVQVEIFSYWLNVYHVLFSIWLVFGSVVLIILVHLIVMCSVDFFCMKKCYSWWFNVYDILFSTWMVFGLVGLAIFIHLIKICMSCLSVYWVKYWPNFFVLTAKMKKTMVTKKEMPRYNVSTLNTFIRFDSNKIYFVL